MTKKLSIVMAFAAGLSLTSCDKDDNLDPLPICPVGAEAAIGTYEGKMEISGIGNDTIVNVRVQVGRTIAIAPMPLNLMMDSIIAIDPKGETAKELSKMVYYSDYAAKAAGESNIEFDIPMSSSDIRILASDKKYHVMRLGIGKRADCVYAKKDSTLSLNLRADDAVLDGKKVERFKEISLTITKAKRSKK